MSRSNYDKPFYVDVGTSVVAIRCASNRYVIVEYDYVKFPIMLKITKDLCDRLNKEAEISRPLRNCDVGTVKEQNERFVAFCKSHKDTNGNCESCSALRMEGRCELVWAQLPYKKEDENKLKPCPFCGNTDIRERKNSDSGVLYIFCNKCGCSTGGDTIKAMAISAWNKRKEGEVKNES